MAETGCYWNVYMRAGGQDWEEGYGKLHFSETSLAIVSTDKRPQTLGYWPLNEATQCRCPECNVLMITFKGLGAPLMFETEDAEEIARTLAMNMKGLEAQPFYQPFPTMDRPPKKGRNRMSVKNRHKPPAPDSDEDNSVFQRVLSPIPSEGSMTPDSQVPISPALSSHRNGSVLVSPKQLHRCEIEKRVERDEDNMSNDVCHSPSIRADELPPTYEDAVPAFRFPSDSQPPIQLRPKRPEQTDENQETNTHHNKRFPNLKLKIPNPAPLVHPIPSPRNPRNLTPINAQPPPRPPKSPLIRRNPPPLVKERIGSPPQAQERTGFNGQPHPLPPSNSPPPSHRNQDTLIPKQRRPVPIPRYNIPLSRVKSRSLDYIHKATSWETNPISFSGGGILRNGGSRRTIRGSSRRCQTPKTYSDDDIPPPSDDREEIYDISNILNHLSNHRNDRSFRVSTMFYVNMLSMYDKPPPPLPPRDPIEPITPTVQPEYFSAMMICNTLKNVLHKDPPIPDTLQFSYTLRNKVCMMLYINVLGVKDWRDLAETVGLEYQAVELIEAFTAHHNHETSAEIVLRHWQFCYNRYGKDSEKCRVPCTQTNLVDILRNMERHDIIKVVEDSLRRTL